MQQLQENIKKDIIEHAFRNIEIIYEVGKTTLTRQDDELLALYIRLHDVELNRKNTLGKLFQESVTLDENIETLHKELKKVQTTFDTCCSLADKLCAPNYIVEETSLSKLALAREKTEEELKDYNEKILAIYEAAKALQEKVASYHENDDNRINDLYGKVSTLSMEHMANWENNAINSVAFDEQFDNFRGYTQAMESQREELIRSCDEAINNYTSLNQQTATLYNVWNEFVKRCDLLKTLSEIHNSATGFTAN